MNASQIHLFFNHWPIIGSMLGFMLLLAGKMFPAIQSKRSGLLVLILSALLAIPTLLSGEGAEEIVEDQGIVSHEVIHEHEEAAEKAFWAIEVLGILALLALIMDIKNAKPEVLINVVLIVSLVVSVMLIWVGKTGGLIKHPELDGQIENLSQPAMQEQDDD